MKAKLKIVIPIAAAIIAVIIATAVITLAPGSGEDYASFISTAQQDLVDQNYEQATAEFSKVIEHNPMNIEAYIGIAEAYIGLSDTDSAVQWLEKGYELTGDERLREMIDSLSGSEPKETDNATDFDDNPEEINRVSQVSLGCFHSAAAASDGSLYM